MLCWKFVGGNSEYSGRLVGWNKSTKFVCIFHLFPQKRWKTPNMTKIWCIPDPNFLFCFWRWLVAVGNTTFLFLGLRENSLQDLAENLVMYQPAKSKTTIAAVFWRQPRLISLHLLSCTSVFISSIVPVMVIFDHPSYASITNQ